ncbi:unnamed protein product [Heterobilharzia americana]|nr:unnamed protein product [Heterobilharzia americana]
MPFRDKHTLVCIYPHAKEMHDSKTAVALLKSYIWSLESQHGKQKYMFSTPRWTMITIVMLPEIDYFRINLYNFGWQADQCIQEGMELIL